MKRIAIGLGVLLSAMAGSAMAMTFMKVDYVCPVGGERFSADTMGSGTAFGHFLDGRVFGAIQSPWPLVQCPGNGFLLFRDEYSKDELQALTAYVASAEYQRLRGTETSYWLLSRLMQVVKAPAQEQASVLQQATWQASAAQYPRYVAAATAAFVALCPDDRALAERDGQWLYCQRMLGEWERRQSRFDAARARFTRLQPLVATLVTGEDRERVGRQVAAEIVQQLQLIGEGNPDNTMAVDVNAPGRHDDGDDDDHAEQAIDTAAAAADAAAAAAHRGH